MYYILHSAFRDYEAKYTETKVINEAYRYTDIRLKGIWSCSSSCNKPDLHYSHYV
jgi:hypothetical protein